MKSSTAAGDPRRENHLFMRYPLSVVSNCDIPMVEFSRCGSVGFLLIFRFLICRRDVAERRLERKCTSFFRVTLLSSIVTVDSE